MTDTAEEQGPAAPRPAPPPVSRVIDRLIRALLGLAVATGLAWGLWMLGGGGAGAGVMGSFAGVATIAVWLVFETPGDPGRGWFGRVAVPGLLRLVGELALLGLAATAIWLGGSRAASETLLTVAGLHIFLSWERVAWLCGRRGAVAQGKD
jgi:hypothetical protein